MPRWSSRVGSVWVAGALAASAVPLTAQQNAPTGGSVLYLLTPTGSLTPGQEVRGALSSSDYLSTQNRYLDAWTLDGHVGARLTIDLLSDDFDAYVHLIGPGFAEALGDDDGGAGCNARLVVTFLENGVFRVVASSNSATATGVYTIRVTEGEVSEPTYPCGGIDPEALRGLPTANRSLALGDTANGRFTASDTRLEHRPVQAWTLRGVAGQSVSVLLHSSAFDSYLYLLGPGLPEVLSDDDGGSGLDARIDVTFPENGTYLVIASALSERATGPYALIVAESRIVDDLRELEPEHRMLDLGQAGNGALMMGSFVYEGRPVQAWAYEGTAGQRIAVTLESTAFDAYLYVIGPGLMTPLHDDDSGEGLNARIDTTLPETGTYLLVASGLRDSSSGAYTIRVVARP